MDSFIENGCNGGEGRDPRLLLLHLLLDDDFFNTVEFLMTSSIAGVFLSKQSQPHESALKMFLHYYYDTIKPLKLLFEGIGDQCIFSSLPEEEDIADPLL